MRQEITQEFVSNGGNFVLRRPDFYISYNPSPGLISGPETALVIDDEFYILSGDWRDEYYPLAFKGKEACLSFFREKAPDFFNFWSTAE